MRSTFRAPSLAAISLLAAACTADAGEVAPPRYDAYYPTGLALAPDDGYLFVANANSDLRYDSGTVQVIDLDAVEGILEVWKPPFEDKVPPAYCTRDALFPSTLSCRPLDADGNTSPFVLAASTVRIGNFASAIGVQQLEGGRLRVFVTVRGDPSLTWADFDPAASVKLSCTNPPEEFGRCSEANRLDELRNDPELGFLSDEPFSLFVDGAAQRVFMTHLTTGRVSVASAPLAGEPKLDDVITGLWAPTASGAISAVGVAARRPGDPDSLIYVTSRSEARVATIRAVQGTDGLQLVPGPAVLLVPDRTGLNGDTRGITFSADGDRAYVISRSPPSLMVFDTSLGPTGVPRNEHLGSIEICGQPANLAVGDAGSGPMAYVPCFATGQVWAVDLQAMQLLDTIEVGRGPNAVVFSTARKRVYVANYAEDTIAVIDADPASETFNHTLVRLGNPRSTEGQ